MEENILSLEQTRAKKGNAACTGLFANAIRKYRNQALKMLADPQLTFPCLYILIPQISEHGLEKELPAFLSQIYNVVMHIDDAPGENEYLSHANENTHKALRWMIETGSRDPEPNSGYQKTMDIAVSILIHTYHDSEILPHVADMIFARRKRGDNVHELIWAFFRSRNPQSLRLIALKLPQADAKEAEFIRDLLGIADWQELSQTQQYQKYIQMLDSSAANIQFAEENKQYMSRPVVCRLNGKKSEKKENKNERWRF